MGSAPAFAPSDNPASDHPSLLTRTLTFLYLPTVNFGLLLFPRWLSFDWSMESIPLIHFVADPRNVFSLLFYTCLFLLIQIIYAYYQRSAEWKSFRHATFANGNGYSAASSNGNTCSCAPCCYQHHHHQQPHLRHLKRPFNLKATNNNSMCSTLDDDYCSAPGTSSNNNGAASNGSALYDYYSNGNGQLNEDASNSNYLITRTDSLTMATALLVIPFLPATNVFFYVGFVIAERILYIPSFGFCLLVAIGVESLMKRKTLRLITKIALSILLMSFSLRTFVRNIDWLSEENLYRAGIAINPPKGK